MPMHYLPSGTKLLPSLIGLNAPKVTTLIQGTSIEPMVENEKTGKHKQTNKTEMKPLTKNQKTIKDEDLAEIVPEVDEFLNDDVMGEEIDAAGVESGEESQADEGSGADEIIADEPEKPEQKSPSPRRTHQAI